VSSTCPGTARTSQEPLGLRVKTTEVEKRACLRAVFLKSSQCALACRSDPQLECFSTTPRPPPCSITPRSASPRALHRPRALHHPRPPRPAVFSTTPGWHNVPARLFCATSSPAEETSDSRRASPSYLSTHRDLPTRPAYPFENHYAEPLPSLETFWSTHWW
jgi:hypothetical protein